MTDPVAITLATVVAIAAAAALKRTAKDLRTEHLRQLERQRQLAAIKAEFDFIAAQINQAKTEAFAAYMADDLDGYRKGRERVNLLLHRLHREVNTPLTKLP